MNHLQEPSTDEFTVDSFHRDAFRLVQPARQGHRAGIDAMLLAAAVPDGFSDRVADLGAGAGAAGFAVAARCESARVTLVEQASEMAECARMSIAHPHNAPLAARLSVLVVDVTQTGRQREVAGLASNAFDCVIMNPPFNKASDRATPDALKRTAHVMGDDLFERWIRTAAAIAKPGAMLALIARPVSLGAILTALERRFGGALIVPVHPDTKSAAIRIVLRAVKDSRAGLALQPPLFLHEAGHQYSARADALANGRATLFEG